MKHRSKIHILLALLSGLLLISGPARAADISLLDDLGRKQQWNESPRRIVTAGLGGVFPAGIVIGYVQNLELDTGGLFKSGTVLLDPRLNELHEVAVLVPLNPEQL